MRAARRVLYLIATTCAITGASSLQQNPGPSPRPPAAVLARRVDCRPVLAILRADFAREPSRLLLALEDALITQEACACQALSSAIELVRHDPELISRLVLTALVTVPNQAPHLFDCALVAAPDARPSIEKMLTLELGPDLPDWLKTNRTPPPEALPAAASTARQGRDPVAAAPSAPAPDSAAVASAEQEDFFPTLSISGIYLTIPNVRQNHNRDLPERQEIRRVITVRKPLRTLVVSPATRDFPE